MAYKKLSLILVLSFLTSRSAVSQESWTKYPGSFIARDGSRFMAYGAPMSTGISPENSANRWLEENDSVLAVPQLKLVPVRAHAIGQGKFSLFVYRQVFENLPVEEGTLRILVSNNPPFPVVFVNARLASPKSFSVISVNATKAQSQVRRMPEYADLNVWSIPELVIYQPDAVRAWKFTGQTSGLAEQRGFTFFVAAETGQLLNARNEIYHADVEIQVKSFATPGMSPDYPPFFNPPVEMKLPFAPLTLPGGTKVYANSEGNYTIEEAQFPFTVQADLKGEWVDVMNAQGPNLQLSQTLESPGVLNLKMNPTPVEFTTSQVNAFIHATKTHDFYKQKQPEFTGLDLPLKCNVNVLAYCNANFNSLTMSLNFFNAAWANACANTAYSSVVAHEYGHFIHFKLGLGGPAFSEGFADTVSVLLYDDPIIGKNFYGPYEGSLIRNVETANEQYPCFGDGHDCGQVLAGVWWDTNVWMKQTLGNELGLEVARQCFADWSQITDGEFQSNSAHPKTAIEVLTIDDDDGDLSNGTPHYYEICSAFAKHNIPCPYDCNRNGVLDSVDLGTDSSQDCNSNGIPDECDLDCDQNGVPDDCQIATDPSLDCNKDGFIDSCQGLQIFEAWTYDVGNNIYTNAKSIAADSQNNLYVIGTFRGTVDFDPTGNVDLHSSTGDSSTDDIFLIKIKTDGSYGWTKTFGGSAPEVPTAVRVDSFDNVFVLGTFYGVVDFDPGPGVTNKTSAGAEDVFLSKFNSDGNYLWTQTWGGAFSDEVSDLVCTQVGTLFVAGNFYLPLDLDPGPGIMIPRNLGLSDSYLSKFNNDGSFVWAKTWGGENNDKISKIKANAEGLWIVGTFEGSVDFDPGEADDIKLGTNGGNLFLSRWTLDGEYLWTQIGSGVTNPDIAGLALSGEGNIYITGSFWGGFDFDLGPNEDSHVSVAGSKDLFLTKVNPEGQTLWTKTWGGSAFEQMTALAINQNDEPVVLGRYDTAFDGDPGPAVQTFLPQGLFDIFITKFTATGDYAWSLNIGSDNLEQAYAAVIPAQGSLIYAGNFSGKLDFDPTVAESIHDPGVGANLFVSKLLLPNAAYFADCNLNGTPDGCDIQQGLSLDFNQNSIPDECERFSCSADLNHDGKVGNVDLGILLANWGTLSFASSADLDGNGAVDAVDLGLLLLQWGDCLY